MAKKDESVIIVNFSHSYPLSLTLCEYYLEISNVQSTISRGKSCRRYTVRQCKSISMLCDHKISVTDLKAF